LAKIIFFVCSPLKPKCAHFGIEGDKQKLKLIKVRQAVKEDIDFLKKYP
jgi:hypothetical protein